MKYYQFKEKNYKPLHDFISKNVFFAFSNEQFEEGLKKFNITREEAPNKLHRYYGGGFILIEKEHEEDKITRACHKAQRKYLSKFKNLVSALRYEMGNHECAYTGDYLDGLHALGYRTEDLKKNKRLLKAYLKARQQAHDWFIKHC